MSMKVKAILYRFLLLAFVGFLLGLVPVLESTVSAGPDSFNPRAFLWAVLTALVLGAAGAVEKYFAPQLLAVLADAGQGGAVLPVTSSSLKDVQLSPPPQPTLASSTGSESSPAVPPLVDRPGDSP